MPYFTVSVRVRTHPPLGDADRTRTRSLACTFLPCMRLLVLLARARLLTVQEGLEKTIELSLAPDLNPINTRQSASNYMLEPTQSRAQEESDVSCKVKLCDSGSACPVVGSSSIVVRERVSTNGREHFFTAMLQQRWKALQHGRRTANMGGGSVQLGVSRTLHTQVKRKSFGRSVVATVVAADGGAALGARCSFLYNVSLSL